MKVEVQLDPEREGLVLVATPDGNVELLRRLADQGIPARSIRRVEGVLVPFGTVDDLEELGLDLGWEPLALHVSELRRRIGDAAPTILDRAKAIVRGKAVDAREMLSAYEWTARLDDHQAKNVAALTLRGGWGGCVFDEQGTGKTITTIAVFDVLFDRNEADVLLVAAPKSMIAEWADEFQTFLGDMYRVAVLDGNRTGKARAIEDGHDVVVANYETIVSMLPTLKLLARRCRVVLAVDESYNVKNPDARRSQAIGEIRELCTRAYVLCGTPAPNAPQDIVEQFNIVDLGYTFENVQIPEDPQRAIPVIQRAMRERGLYVRNLKEEVLPDLPSRTFIEIPVDLEPVQARAYEAAIDSLILDLRTATDAEYRGRIMSYLERRSALLRICSNPSTLLPGYEETPAKLLALDEILDQLVRQRGEKVVVWSFYRASLDAIATRYEQYGIARIDGTVLSTSARREAVKRFQEDDSIGVFVGNPAAAGAGLTLHRARIAIYESLSNQAAHFLQSLDRIHRRGQYSDVEYLTLLASGTLEQLEYDRLLEKSKRQAELLDDPGSERPSRELMLSELLEARALLENASSPT